MKEKMSTRIECYALPLILFGMMQDFYNPLSFFLLGVFYGE